MSLPTPTDLTTMDYSFLGEPFVNVPAKVGIDLTTMDFSFLGEPFVSNGFQSVPQVSTSEFFMFF